MKKCQDYLEVKGMIQVYEFLYLVTNTIPRQSYLEKIPKYQIDIDRSNKFKLFSVDTTGLHSLKNPEEKI